MAIENPNGTPETPAAKKSDRVAIFSKDLTDEHLEMLNAPISEESEALNYLHLPLR